MARQPTFPVLIATDGSPQARAAVAAASSFPWPRGATVHAVVAREPVMTTLDWPEPVRVAINRRLAAVASGARRVLARRRPGAAAVVRDQSPVTAILTEAGRIGARAIVLGSRGHGALGRFLLGSVSRGVARQADCAVLVVKGRRRDVRSLVLGADGSANSRHAVAFVAALPPPARGRVTLVRAVEPVTLPTIGLLPARIRRAVASQAAALAAGRLAAARREVETAARRLTRAGWRTRTVVGPGVPLTELLRQVAETRADLLVVGARGVGGVERLLLGSVAEGALGRSPVSVLVVR